MNYKFRAWDNKRGEWYNESKPDLETYYGFGLFSKCCLLCPPLDDDLSHLTITQWSTFTDINKVEIYAGDIVKVGESYIGDSYFPPTTATVKFEDGWFFVDAPGETDLQSYVSVKAIEVIGNIFTCACYQCLHDQAAASNNKTILHRMILCSDCGNKRCPKAANHNLKCTNSNEPGQKGSLYE